MGLIINVHTTLFKCLATKMIQRHLFQILRKTHAHVTMQKSVTDMIASINIPMDTG